jgi:hypothetical protein
VLLDPVPVFNTLPTASRARMLGIEKWIPALSGLPTVEVRIGHPEGLTNPFFSGRLQPIYSLPASIVDGSNIQFLMPKVVPNQLILK